VGVSTVDLVEYSEDWPAQFDRERVLLERLLGADALRIDHIGSTAPGLLAKPTIDIAVGVRSIDTVRHHQTELENVGYDFRGGFHDDHLMVRRVANGERTHHLHFRVYPSDEYEDWIAFRDLLRSDPTAVAAYAAVKRQLAARHYADRNAYVDGKTEVVVRLVREARGR
jgi:GrpB-like predicted nucleotidyltransferase (UPF0157 family)